MNLTVMTYNIQHGHIHQSDPGRIDLTGTASVIRDSGADVIGLNEVRGLGEHPEYTAQVEEMAAFLGYHCVFGRSIYVGGHNPYGNAVLSSAFPVLTRQYWYITAYFCLFFLMPAINALIRNASPRFTVYLVAVSLILFSVLPSVTGADLFHTGRGYAPLWLAVMYGIGAACRKYPVLERIRPSAALAGFFACAALTWAVKRGIELADIGYLNKYVYHEYMVTYSAITTVAASVLLLAFFSKAAPKRTGWISFTCPLVLGVYLLHVHPLIFGNLFAGLFKGLAALPAPVMALAAVLLAIAVFAVCAAADYLRLLLFNALHIRQFCAFLDRKLTALFRRMVPSKADPE